MTDREYQQKKIELLILLALMECEDACEALNNGESPQVFVRTFGYMVKTWHNQAEALALSASTNATHSHMPVGSVSQAAANTEMQYISKLIADLLGGKYTKEDGSYDIDAIFRRMSLYTRRIVGTANRAWLNSIDPNTEIHWVYGDTVEHCPGCNFLVDGNPWTASTIPTVPGAGDTECLFNCGCWLSDPASNQIGYVPDPDLWRKAKRGQLWDLISSISKS